MCFKISFATCRPFFLWASICHDVVVLITRTGITSMCFIKIMFHSQIMANFMSHKLSKRIVIFLQKYIKVSFDKRKKKFYPSIWNRVWTPFIDRGFPSIMIGRTTNYRTPSNANSSPKWTFIICHIYYQISGSNNLWSMRFDSFKTSATGNNFLIQILKVTNPFKFDFGTKWGMAIPSLNMGSSSIPIRNNFIFAA